MMEIHEKFTKWAIEKGVKINGIRPHRFEGRGIGIIAERDFKVRRTFFTLYLHVLSKYNTIMLSIAIRNLHHEFLVSSYVFMFWLYQKRCHFNSNNMILVLSISASYLLIISIGRSPLVSAHLLCQLLPKPLKLSSTSIFVHIPNTPHRKEKPS